jgi:hypothetical protein
MSLLLRQYLQCTHTLIKEAADFFNTSQIISWKEYLDKRGVSDLIGNIMLLYPARSRWGTYRGCYSRRDGARTSVKAGSWAGRTHLQ